MCGIAGILSDRSEPDLNASLSAMQAALAHRGPDDGGREVLELPGGLRLGLAHTRLSILDLSPAGRQPMADPETGSRIVFNGEIYNHAEVRRGLPDAGWRSTGDTETLLRGWGSRGETLLGQLRGMFAFALYDRPRGRLWLVRDRLGVKPLYLARGEGNTWLFASEVRALLASGLVGRRLDREAVEAYLAFGSVIAPRTLLTGVESLLPGEWRRFDLDRPGRPIAPEAARWWKPPFGQSGGAPIGRAEALDRIRPVLIEAVSLRMVSDVPVGVFLSGGIDSGGIVATLSAAGRKLHTFSVVFGESRYDESVHARAVSERFGTVHSELRLEPSAVLQEFDRGLAAYDQPSADGLNTYFISQATREAGVKVALSGLGGDELFAGYSYFRLVDRMSRPWRRLSARPLHWLMRLVRPSSAKTAKLGEMLAGDGSSLSDYAACRQVMAGPRRRALLAGAAGDPNRFGGRTHGPGGGPADTLPALLRRELSEAAAALDPVNAYSLLELSVYLADTLLRDTDQMSMAHALEVREPLLDHVLVETLARLPGPLKLEPGRGGPNKGLLLDSLPAELPRSVTDRHKMGFALPWDLWLRDELRAAMDEILSDRAAAESAGLGPEAVRTLWEDFSAARPGLRFSDVLGLANLISWVRRHRIGC